MASSCIPTAIRLDLEMMKAAAAGAAPPRPAHSAPSSTLSEASNAASSSTSSVASLSLKRPRTPRKRPNQTYNEAAALLASMYPSVFPAAKGPGTAPPRLLGLASALADDPDSSDLLPPFPVLGHAAFLLRDLPHPQPPPTPWSPAKSCPSPAAVSSVFSEFRDPAPPSPATPDAAAADELGELDFDDDDDGGFDADSFLGVDEGATEGIDAIMGKLTVGNDVAAPTSASSYMPCSDIQTYLRNVMMLQLGFRHGQLNKSQALKGQAVDSKWWMCPAIPVKEIAPPPPQAQVLVVPENKKKSKNKVVGWEMNIAAGHCRKAEEGFPHSADIDPRTLVLPKTGLGLRLNSEEVLKAWCGRGSVFADANDADLPRTSADVLVKHSDSDLVKENVARGVIREGNILKMQHKQKHCTPVVSNKSRYYRPRVKGRFVSKAYLLQQAAEKEKEG